MRSVPMGLVPRCCYVLEEMLESIRDRASLEDEHHLGWPLRVYSLPPSSLLSGSMFAIVYVISQLLLLQPTAMPSTHHCELPLWNHKSILILLYVSFLSHGVSSKQQKSNKYSLILGVSIVLAL